jgi:hypothetical protein
LISSAFPSSLTFNAIVNNDYTSVNYEAGSVPSVAYQWTAFGFNSPSVDSKVLSISIQSCHPVWPSTCRFSIAATKAMG